MMTTSSALGVVALARLFVMAVSVDTTGADDPQTTMHVMLRWGAEAGLLIRCQWAR